MTQRTDWALRLPMFERAPTQHCIPRDHEIFYKGFGIMFKIKCLTFLSIDAALIANIGHKPHQHRASHAFRVINKSSYSYPEISSQMRYSTFPPVRVGASEFSYSVPACAAQLGGPRNIYFLQCSRLSFCFR